MVEGGAGGGVEVDVLGDGGLVASHHSVARHPRHTVLEIGRRVPRQAEGGGDASPMVLVATPGLHVAVIDLRGARDVPINHLLLGLYVVPSFGIKYAVTVTPGRRRVFVTGWY